MDYNKNIWKDSVLQYPNRYTQNLNGDGTINLYRYTGTVTQDQTEVIAERMNNIEYGISNSNESSLYKSISGSANVIMCTFNETLTDGYIVRFISSGNNNGNSTSINGIPVYKINSTSPPIISNGEKVVLCYNLSNNCFYYQFSSEGTAISSDVLTGFKFSNNSALNITSVMPNNGYLTSTITNTGGIYSIPMGYNTGGRIYAPSLATMTNATVNNSNQIKLGYKAYSNGILYTGTNDLPSGTQIGSVVINASGIATITGLSGNPVLGFLEVQDGKGVYGSDGYDCVYSHIYDPRSKFIPTIYGGTSSMNTYTFYSKQKSDVFGQAYGLLYHYYDNRISYSNGTLTISGYVTPNAVGKHVIYLLLML